MTAPRTERLFIYLDFCFFEYCNFTCSYCRDSNHKMSRGQTRTEFDRALQDFLTNNRAAVLKLSGYGEATLWPPLVDAISYWASKFPTVQLITNGAGPPEVIDQLSELPNFQVCITLDGHTAEMNRLRTKGDSRLHARVIETIDRLIATQKRVELNCVITEANASHFHDYLVAARKMWGTSATIIPFPVRMTLGRETQGDDACRDATPAEVTALEDVIVKAHSEFYDQLPPLAYTLKLIEFMRRSQRSDRCHIHRANFGVNTKFQALACACAGDRLIRPLGPITAIGSDPEVERRQAYYLREGNVGAKCITCFTHYDVVNLYLEGVISDEDVARMPSLSAPETLIYLREIKKEMHLYLGN